MSGIWKFWIVSGMALWFMLAVCLIAVAYKKAEEAIYRARKPEYERCTLCEGERWLWKGTDGWGDRIRVRCPDCKGTGRTEVKRK